MKYIAFKKAGGKVDRRAGYEELDRILDEAYHQAAYGKGVERHGGDNLPFTEQRMLQIARMQGGTLGMQFQVMKKAGEAVGLPTLEAQKRELLGAINYIAGMIIFLEEQDAAERARQLELDMTVNGGEQRGYPPVVEGEML